MFTHCGCRHAGQLREDGGAGDLLTCREAHWTLRKRWVKASRFCTGPSPHSNTCGLLVFLGRSWTVDYNDQRWQWALPQAATGVGLVAEREWQPRCDCGALRSHIEEELRS